MNKEPQEINLLRVLYLIFQNTGMSNELDIQLKFLSREIRKIRYVGSFDEKHICQIEYVETKDDPFIHCSIAMAAHPGFDSLIPTSNGLFKVIGCQHEIEMDLRAWDEFYNNSLIADVKLWRKMIALLYLRNMDVTLDFTNPRAVYIQALDNKTNLVLNITPPEGTKGHNVAKLRYLSRHLKDQQMRFTSWGGITKLSPTVIKETMLRFDSIRKCLVNDVDYVPELGVKLDCDFAIRRWFGTAEVNDYLTVESDGTINVF